MITGHPRWLKLKGTYQGKPLEGEFFFDGLCVWIGDYGVSKNSLLFADMGITPEKIKEGIMEGSATKKARVPKVPEKVKVGTVHLDAAETKKLYKLLDKGGHVARHAQMTCMTQTVASRGFTLTGGEDLVLDTSNILNPRIVVMALPPPKVKVARKPKVAAKATKATKA